jgi:hypothetical protein
MNRPRKSGTPTVDGYGMPFFRPEGSKASHPAVAGSDVDGWRRPKRRKLRPWCGVASIFVVVGVVVGCGRRCGLARSSGIYIIHYLSKSTVPKI